jgi:hypothetical protein
MILRMYELAATDLERLAGWPADAGQYAGPLRVIWPQDALAIELAISAGAGGQRRLTEAERQAGMRRLIPWLVRKILENQQGPTASIVARLDGRLQPGSLTDALRYLDPAHTSLFNLTGASRLLPALPFPAATVSMAGDPDLLTTLCSDSALSFREHLRLRVFAMPQEDVVSALEAAQPDDQRWEGLMSRASLYLTPSASMESVFVVGPGHAEELRNLIAGPDGAADRT